MHRLPLLLLALSCALAVDAGAQDAPSSRRPAADSIRMAEEGEVVSIDELEEEAADEDAPADTVPVPAAGPYARAAGTGPFTVQASGEPAPRPARGEVVWVNAGPARPAARDTARAGTGARVASGSTAARHDTASASTPRPAARDTVRTGSGGRVAAGSATRRDTASPPRPASRDTARTGSGQRVSSGSAARRDTASANRPALRDTVRIGGGQRAGSGQTARRDTAAARRNNAGSTTPATRPTGSSTPATRARTHTVAGGETFYGIARRYGVTAAQLRALNPDVDMNALEVGDVLRLPAGARDSRAPAQPPRTGAGTPARPPAAPAAPRGSRTHTVAAGETLFGIARRYGVTVAAIRQANGMQADGVQIGQRLVIPPAR